MALFEKEFHHIEPHFSQPYIAQFHCFDLSEFI
jgi:hypothetical protein